VYGHYKNRYEPSATSVVIARNNLGHQPGVSALTKTIHGPAAAKLLNEVKSWKPLPTSSDPSHPFVTSCPANFGLTYTLTFTNPSLTATADATGCQWVTVNDETYRSTDAFWKDVSKATGQPIIPESIYH
jgi:hypothetical protein